MEVTSKIKFADKGVGSDLKFRRFDYGLRGEMGLDFKLSKNTLRLSASYQQGLANLLPSLPDSGSRYKARHQVLSLGLTYFFAQIPLHTK